MAKTISLTVAALAALFALGWLCAGNDLMINKVFAPRQEAVRRQVFEQSKAYNQGMVQELQNMQFEYIKASPEHKAALADLILHRAADYPEENMPADLRQFIHDLKGGAK
jgi:hypothetical protein